METEDHNIKCKLASCTLGADIVDLIDHYAEGRGLYRSNWLREAITEKLNREVKAETGRHPRKREVA